MSFKSILLLFIPPVFLKIKRFIINKKKKYFSSISKIIKNSEELVILGNGPTLKETLDIHFSDVHKYDWMAVNNFCKTKYFKKVKPQFYVIADPSNLGKLENLSELLKEETESIACSLLSVSWSMNLIVPDFAEDSYLINQLKQNLNIKIFYYNTQNFSKNKNVFFDLDNNLIAPPAQTVINTCLYIGIFLNYKNIYIHGMDMSWHEDLELDQKTNILYIVDKHFYGTKKRPAILDVNGYKGAKVHEYLSCSVKALESFWDLRSYADYKGAKVTNMSPHSWVDAFERWGNDEKK